MCDPNKKECKCKCAGKGKGKCHKDFKETAGKEQQPETDRPCIIPPPPPPAPEAPKP